MREDLTELAVVMDRSGSMEAIREDAIGGFNSFLAGQKQDPGELKMTLVLFNHEIATLHAGVPLAEVPNLDGTTYVPEGTTALLDAVGRTIDDLGKRLAATPEPERPGKVIVAILTDGLENASTDYDYDQIRKRVRHQTKTYGWEFLFLAANQDAVLGGARLAIEAPASLAFAATPEGFREASSKLDQEVRKRKQRPTGPVN